jgi:hypothetical protein
MGEARLRSLLLLLLLLHGSSVCRLRRPEKLRGFGQLATHDALQFFSYQIRPLFLRHRAGLVDQDPEEETSDQKIAPGCPVAPVAPNQLEGVPFHWTRRGHSRLPRHNPDADQTVCVAAEADWKCFAAQRYMPRYCMYT